MKLRIQTLALALVSLAATASAEDSQTTDAPVWTPVDAESCVQASPDSGGNPGGYLDLLCGVDTRALALSSRSLLPSMAGQRWTVSFDLVQLDAASLGTVQLVLSSPGGSWSYMQGWEIAPQGAWRRYSVTFDPRWSDGLAMVNGWYSNVFAWEDRSADNWAATMKAANEVQLSFGTTTSSQKAHLGIDNVEVRPAL